jgi:putative transposase
MMHSGLVSKIYTSPASVAKGPKLRAGLGRWITYYDIPRPHSGLAGKTPVEAYRRIGQSDHGGHAPYDLMSKQAA